MLDTIQKLTYRAKANIPNAAAALKERLCDRLELPLAGIHGERLYLTSVSQLEQRAAQLQVLYGQLPTFWNSDDNILLDAWASASIEGAKASLPEVKKNLSNPQTRDENMVVNAVRGSNYAYGRPITQKNLRTLWEKVTEGVCENTHLDGKPYRSGMIEIGSASRTVHTPATPERLHDLMEQWFRFREQDQSLIGSFSAPFYFVYVHPFCDGNGRTARIINASTLYHAGWKKMKSLPLSNAINNAIHGYYRSLEDSEEAIQDANGKWLDLSPFVSYMLDVFEQCMIDAALFRNELTPNETKLLDHMNLAPGNAEITVKKAAAILGNSESAARNTLRSLVKKGYLTEDMSKVPFIYSLDQHLPL